MAETKDINQPKVLIIGGSAGSLSVLLYLLPQLEAGFQAPVIIVTHRQNTDNGLEQLLSTKTKLRVKEIEDKDKVSAATIYIAPADYHLLIEKDATFSLDVSEKVNYSRPSIDVAFESAAQVYGPQLIAILLSGANSDGVEGLKAVKQYGGLAVVQDPASAEVPYMPVQALQHLKPDYVVAAKDLAALVNSLV